MDKGDRVGGYTVEARLDKGGAVELLQVSGARDARALLRLYPKEPDGQRAVRLAALRQQIDTSVDGVAKLLEAGEHEGRVFAAMEAVQGATLRTVLRHRDMTPRTSLTVLASVAEVMHRAGQSGMTVAWIEPERILVQRQGRGVTVLEPGTPIDLITGAVDATATVRSLEGVRYLSPEGLNTDGGSRVEPARALVYSLGVIGYEMLTGGPPGGRLRLPSHVNSDVPPEVDAVILRSLSREPRDRYRDPGEMAADIRRLQQQLPGLSSAALPGRALASRKRVAVAVGALIVVLAVVLGMRAC